MKKLVTLTSFFLFVMLNLSASETITLPPFQTDSLRYGDVLRLTITNRGTLPATFFPQFVVRDSSNSIINEKRFISYSDDSFMVYFRSQITASLPDSQRYQALLTLAQLIKSPLFINGQIRISHWDCGNVDSAYAKLMTPIGNMNSTSHQQCAEFRDMFIQICTLSGFPALSVDYLQKVGVANHQLLAMRFDSLFVASPNTWVKVDPDPSTTSLVDTLPGGKLASMDDIMMNNSIAGNNPYYWAADNGTHIRINNMAASYYRTLFTSFSYSDVLIGMPQLRTVKGDITLCSECSATWTSPVNYFFSMTGVLSSSDSALSIHYGQMWHQGNMLGLDSLAALLGTIIREPDSLIRAALLDGTARFKMIGTAWEPKWTFQPNIIVKVTANHQGTITIGQDQGLKACGLVRDVKATDGSIQIGNLTVTDSLHTDPWFPSGTLAPYLGNDSVNYLDNGIIEAGTGGTFSVSYNPFAHNWVHGGTYDQLGVSDTLALTQTVNNRTVFALNTVDTPEIITGVQKPTGTPIKIYPVPSTGMVTIEIPREERIGMTLSNLAGQNVRFEIISENETSAIIKIEITGVYFLRSKNNNVGRIVITN